MWKQSFAVGSLSVLAAITIPLNSIALPAELEKEKPLWVLLHGIWPGSGRDWRYVAPVLEEQGQTVLRPTLPSRTGLFSWANNIAQFIVGANSCVRPRADTEVCPYDQSHRKISVVAHSFSGAAVLFLLRTAYELKNSTLDTVIAQLNCERFQGRAAWACHEISDGWHTLLSDAERAQRWIAATQKIEKVFLYHSALQGACGVCLDFLGLGGGTTASLCLLSQLGSSFFLPIEHVTWAGTISVVNLYGGGEWMLSLCGLRENDFALSRGQQLLKLSDGLGCYREIFSDSHMHFAFAVRRGVGYELAHKLHNLAQEICGGAQ